MVYRNQKVLQVKTLEPEELRREFPIELCDPIPMPIKSDKDKPTSTKTKVMVDKADKSTGEDSDEIIFEDFDQESTNSSKT